MFGSMLEVAVIFLTSPWFMAMVLPLALGVFVTAYAERQARLRQRASRARPATWVQPYDWATEGL